MTISTLATLKTAVATWTVRTDLTSLLSDIVQLAESDIRKDVRCQAMETLATGTLTGETLDMPTGFIVARRLKVGRYVQKYVTPAEYADLDEEGTTRAIFTVIGQKLYILNGALGDPYSLIYLKAFVALAADGDTNWLLTNHPDVYLWAGCAKVAMVGDDAQAMAKWLALYAGAVAKVNSQEAHASVSGAPLQMRSLSRE